MLIILKYNHNSRLKLRKRRNNSRLNSHYYNNKKIMIMMMNGLKLETKRNN